MKSRESERSVGVVGGQRSDQLRICGVVPDAAMQAAYGQISSTVCRRKAPRVPGRQLVLHCLDSDLHWGANRWEEKVSAYTMPMQLSRR